MIRILGLLFLFLNLCLHPVQRAVAQDQGWTPDLLEDFRQRIEAVRIERGVPSAQIALIGPDTTVFMDFGTADLATGTPVDEMTMFRVGSVSKTVAGVAMMMLVERGLVSLDDPLRELAPELDIRNPWYPGHPVRLAHLLEASAGFVGFFAEDYQGPPDPPRIPIEEVVSNWPRLDVQWKPGDYPSYHDRGPTITAYLIEKVTGQSYDLFVRKEIFEPLGMARSDYFRTDTIAAYLAEPYASQDSSAVAYAHYSLWPSGSLNTSAREFSRFVRMQLGRGTFDGEQLLRPESVERIETPTTTLAARKVGANLGHGINTFTTNYEGIVYYGHPGNTDNYTAAYGYRPESGTGFVFMSTISESGQWMLWQGINEVLAFLHPDAVPPRALHISPEERAAAAGCYEQLNPWHRGRPLEHVQVREDDRGLVILHEESGRTAGLERKEGPMSFRIRDWREERAEITNVVFVPDDNDRLVLQLLDYPFEAYGRVPCR